MSGFQPDPPGLVEYLGASGIEQMERADAPGSYCTKPGRRGHQTGNTSPTELWAIGKRKHQRIDRF